MVVSAMKLIAPTPTRRLATMSLPYTIGLFVLLVLPQSRAQAPAMVTTTSCRTYPLAPYNPATQVLVKPTTASPSLTSICATTTRPARVSLIAEPGVWAKVFDHWGGCNQSIEFNFNDDWKKYDFGVTWYNDRAAGCTGTPTASMNVRETLHHTSTS